MAKSFIFILFYVSLTIITEAYGSNIDQDGIAHTYAIGFEVGEMADQVGPLPFYVSPMKQLDENSWTGFQEILLNRRMILKSKSNYNFTITTVMPFNQVDVVSFYWEDRSFFPAFAADINFVTSYVTEITPNQPQITKKYCPTGEYPRNVSSVGISRILALC